MHRPVAGFALAAVLALLPAALLASAARADVEVPSILGSGMVLQRDRPVPVWGWADPGEEVTVEFAGQSHRTSADAQGCWRVTLDPLPAQRRGCTLTVRGKNRITLKDVLVGEVWVASGQSNMEWPLAQSDDAVRGWRGPPPSRLRLRTVPHVARALPQADVPAPWVSAQDERHRDAFSGVAWFFGSEIAVHTGVPVGLVNASWGGTAILPWTPSPDAPPPVRGDPTEAGPGEPAALYNGMVAPLVPFAIRGVIWYQGESDAERAADYRQAFPDLIRAWRAVWGQGDFPFYFVQLANFGRRSEAPGDSAWAELREAQLLTLRSVERTGMAVTIDVGEARDIHPRNKFDVGLRLARWARARDYGEDLVPSGPLYASHEVTGGRVVLRFDHTAGRLKARGGARLEGFAVAGADRRFVWAEADIDGETVVVRHRDVPEPVAVRYAWADDPAGNLVNAHGLPASPFRTDEWPRAAGAVR